VLFLNGIRQIRLFIFLLIQSGYFFQQLFSPKKPFFFFKFPFMPSNITGFEMLVLWFYGECIIKFKSLFITITPG